MLSTLRGSTPLSTQCTAAAGGLVRGIQVGAALLKSVVRIAATPHSAAASHTLEVSCTISIAVQLAVGTQGGASVLRGHRRCQSLFSVYKGSNVSPAADPSEAGSATSIALLCLYEHGMSAHHPADDLQPTLPVHAPTFSRQSPCCCSHNSSFALLGRNLRYVTPLPQHIAVATYRNQHGPVCKLSSQ